MSRLEDLNEFDWLPGFREMMACQEKVSEEMIRDESKRTQEPEKAMDETENMVQEGKVSPSWMEENQSWMKQEQSWTEQNQKEILPPEKLQKEEQNYWNDYEYMVQMLPTVAREIWVVADALLDRYEYEGSSMYAEYPDKNAILKIVDAVYDKMKYQECESMENQVDGSQRKNCYYMEPEERGIHTPLRNLIQVVLCWNMLYRRQRYYRRKSLFSTAHDCV